MSVLVGAVEHASLSAWEAFTYAKADAKVRALTVTNLLPTTQTLWQSPIATPPQSTAPYRAYNSREGDQQTGTALLALRTTGASTADLEVLIEATTVVMVSASLEQGSPEYRRICAEAAK